MMIEWRYVVHTGRQEVRVGIEFHSESLKWRGYLKELGKIILERFSIEERARYFDLDRVGCDFSPMATLKM